MAATDIERLILSLEAQYQRLQKDLPQQEELNKLTLSLFIQELEILLN